jgi:hypothetical protein
MVIFSDYTYIYIGPVISVSMIKEKIQIEINELTWILKLLGFAVVVGGPTNPNTSEHVV